jgi:hypothetical protein
MKKGLVTLFLLLLFAPTVFAGIYITDPQDKLVTFKPIINLRGVGKNLEILKVNGQEIGVKSDGSFSCGLVLHPGKNFIQVRALDKYKDHFVKDIRVLYLKTFPDIEALYEGQRHWARNQIVYLSTLGFIEGYPDDRFHPGIPLTRGEFATWIARIKRLAATTLSEDVFFDVPKEHWRAPYVKAVVDRGYMQGHTEKIFGLDEPISRREAASIVVDSEGVAVVEKVKPIFIDVPKAEKGAFPIYVAKETGLVRGVSADFPVYEPDRALTRAEAAVLLARFDRSVNAVRYLFNFKQGYSPHSFCDVNVRPEILSFTADPDTLRVNEKGVVKLRVKIASRDGFSPISKVKIDLLEIGGMPDVEMFDNGKHGDEVKDDLVYSLNISVQPTESGSKTLTASVIDRLGWERSKRTSLLILE